MSSFNKVILMGNLTRDPAQRFLPSGQSVVEIGIATNRKYTAQNGEKREEVTFVDVEAWGKQGEVIAKYFKKGNPIFIEGRLKFDSWQTKEGEKRSKLRVVLERFEFLGGGQGRTQEGGSADLDPTDFGVDAGGGGGGHQADASGDIPF